MPLSPLSNELKNLSIKVIIIYANEYLKYLFREIEKLSVTGIIPQKYLRKTPKKILISLLNSLSAEELFKFLLCPTIYSNFHYCHPFLLKYLNECLEKIQVDKINFRNYKGETAFMVAAENGKSEMVQVLLEHREDPNIVSSSQDNAGVDSNDASSHQNTALHKAIFKNNNGIADLLLKRGANIEICNALGDTPLLMAVRLGKKEMVEFLVEHKADANTKSHICKSSVLLWASYMGFIDIARLILKHRANIDLQNSDGFTALYIATSYRQKNVVQLLLEQGADPNIADFNYHNAPLHMACNNKFFDICELLVNYNKTDMNLRNVNGETPLSIIIKNKNKSM